VTGATSNPTIFAKAITVSVLYDEQLHDLVSAGRRDTQELFFSLALDDVREAARLLRPEYDRTGGGDDSSPSSAHRISPTTPRAQSHRLASCGNGSINRT
jgi:transaldolase